MFLKKKHWMLGVIFVFIVGCGEGSDDAVADDTSSDTMGDSDSGNGADSETDSSEDSSSPEVYADSVCGFTEMVDLGAVEADGMVPVPPNHPDINYFGRVDCTEPTAPSFAFPGVSIRARFTGTAVGMFFDDHGSVTKPNFYNVIIDDGEPTVLEMISGEQKYELASGLPAGEHTVEIFKRVESNSGSGMGVFLGFRVLEGEHILPVAPRPNRIEFIGDSITCGYGNMLSIDDPTDYSYTTENSNAYESWASITARALDAEVSLVAYSGRGVYRNYGGAAGETLPQMYMDCLPDTTIEAAWKTEQFTPQIVVVNLGTNDMSPTIVEDQLDVVRTGYAESMDAFVETLREDYPDAVIVLAVGPMLSNSYPTGYNALSSVRDALRDIVDTRTTAGETNLYFLNLPAQSAPYGEDWHPTVATQTEMSELLVELLTDEGVLPL